MYIYRAYQLNVHADFPIPEFPSGDEASVADVVIRQGVVPTALEQVVGQGALYQANANQFLLTMPDVARYLAQNGNEIIVEPAADSSLNDARVFLLSSCMGALLHQRGILVIHAGAIYTDKGAVLFTGPSGIGKSALLGEFLRRGYKMMADDVCGVDFDSDETPLALPGYPRIQLWTDAARILDQEVKTMEVSRRGMKKFDRLLPQQYWDQPTRLRRVYLLTTSNQGKLNLKSMNRIQALNIALHNTYRKQFLDGLQMRAAHFKLIAAVAKQSDFSRVTRPVHPFRLTELADLIEKDLAQN
jgi:hypothetical protein